MPWGGGGVGHHLPMNNLLLGALPHCDRLQSSQGRCSTPAAPVLLLLPSHTAPWPYTAPHRDASGHPASWGRALWGQEGSRGLGSPDPTASCQQGGDAEAGGCPAGRAGREQHPAGWWGCSAPPGNTSRAACVLQPRMRHPN